jgi:hypothetical protein
MERRKTGDGENEEMVLEDESGVTRLVMLLV